ncbi:MAG TPA: hypothetical protein VFQ35_23450, partial [Polyangiaceae bacterium]|nr:hypothetical protein [Polyangiaceae bacterium]
MKVRSNCLVAAFVLAACGPSGTSSTGVGNPSASFSLSIVNDEEEAESGGTANLGGAGESNAGAPNDAGAPGVPADEVPLARGQIKNALLSIGELRFLPCVSGVPVEVVTMPFIVDLVEKRTYPALPKIRDVEGGYCGIEARLAPARRDPSLVGRSLFFSGTRADGTRFLLYADMQAKLRLRAPAGLPMAGPTPNLVWAMRPRRWLTKAEVDSADTEMVEGLRTIVIDVDRHPLL